MVVSIFLSNIIQINFVRSLGLAQIKFSDDTTTGSLFKPPQSGLAPIKFPDSTTAKPNSPYYYIIPIYFPYPVYQAQYL